MTPGAPRELLGLWCGTDPHPAARREFLRILVAARAASRPVRLLDLRPQAAPALSAHLPEDELRHLEALEDDGVAVERLGGADLIAALHAARSVARLASGTRSATPPVLHLEALLTAGLEPEAVAAALAAAGQVLL